jgi:diguanylate cyclase (GGDEF)-like protein
MQSTEIDQLTGLLNRRGLQTVLQSHSTLGAGALLVANLDRFVFANAVLGLRAGDAMIQQIADLLVGTLPPTSLVARTGGDEFTVLLQDGSLAAATAESLRAHIDELFKPHRRDVASQAEDAGVIKPPSHSLLTLSVGWSLCSTVARHDDVLRLARSACSIAKAAGGNRTFGFEAPATAEGDA